MQLRRQILPHFTRYKTLVVVSLSIFFTSCNEIPSERPSESAQISVREAYSAALSGQENKIVTNWLESLQDPKLTSVVKKALSDNPDLQSTATRLRVAKQGTIIGRATRLPQVNASTSGALSRNNDQTNDSYSLNFNAAWEIDLWGRLRDLENANLADYEASVADFRSARLSLAVNTAQSWCNLITAESQLTLAKETLESFQKNYQIIQRGYKLGTLRPLDDAFGRSNIASAARSLKSSQLDRDEAARTLQLLLGSYPDAQLVASAKLPTMPPIRAGLPSELLARRPDLTARRALIYSSAKRADADRKSLLPDFNLSGSSGTSTAALENLLNPDNLASSIAASIGQNLFSGGVLTAQARQSLADNEEQIRLYERDVLQAFREVESALATDESLKKQEKHLFVEVENTALAEKWAESDFVEGLDTGNRPSILEVLESQRQALDARATLISIRNLRLQNYLDLLLALGGSI